jgi:hypothetical protein
MKDNKYYTPKEEEFFKGFEYEMYQDFDTLPEKEWFQFVYGENGTNNPENMEYPFPIREGRVRVKYLDREDIEEVLGKDSYYTNNISRHLNNEECFSYISTKLNIMLAHYPKTNRISIATADPSKNDIYSKSNWDPNQINLISCKNKSELKRILKDNLMSKIS